ncbi:MAG TPA: hypothetical protein VFV43_01315 [Limnobacter sp.]|nr:hypothetical protein [Limnobacter sp.]
MTNRLIICYTLLILLVTACNKTGEQTTARETDSTTTETPQITNWIFGQWTIDYGEGFELAVGCQRPDIQFGERYVYWRDDVDGEPYEELNRVDEYLIDGDSIRIRITQATSAEPMIFKDGTMHFEQQPDRSVMMMNPRWSDMHVKLIKCESSPFPYSPDVAPTPPRYQGIEPGIVDQPRGDI